MSRVRQKLVVLGVAYAAFIATLALGYYSAAELIAVGALVYRHYWSPKLPPAPAKTRPFGIAIGIALLISLAVVYTPLNLPPIVARSFVYVLFISAGLGSALFLAIDVHQFVRDPVRLVVPPHSALHGFALDFVNAEKNDTIVLWLPRGSIPHSFGNGDEYVDDAQDDSDFTEPPI